MVKDSFTGLGQPIEIPMPLVEPTGDMIKAFGDGVAGLGVRYSWQKKNR